MSDARRARAQAGRGRQAAHAPPSTASGSRSPRPAKRRLAHPPGRCGRGCGPRASSSRSPRRRTRRAHASAGMHFAGAPAGRRSSRCPGPRPPCVRGCPRRSDRAPAGYPQDLLQPARRAQGDVDRAPGDGTVSAPRADGTRAASASTRSDGSPGCSRGGGRGVAAAARHGVRLGRGARALARATARRWSPPTWSAPAARLGTRSRSVRRHGDAHDRRLRAWLRRARVVRRIVPEDLYPWLNLIAGSLVVIVGVSVLRGRLRARGGIDITTITTIPTASRGAGWPRWAPPPGWSRARPRSWCCSRRSRSTRSRSGSS